MVDPSLAAPPPASPARRRWVKPVAILAVVVLAALGAWYFWGSRESVVLTVNQYKAGTVSFLNVVQVQATQLSEERTTVSLLGRRLAATVALIRAMGGTW